LRLLRIVTRPGRARKRAARDPSTRPGRAYRTLSLFALCRCFGFRVLTGAFIRTELKADVASDQQVVTLDAEGEGLSPDARKLFEFAPPPAFGR